jgi:hypothetical protein
MSEGVVIALISALFGAGLTKLVEYIRREKEDRERWENNLRASYGILLNHIYDYPRLTAGEWQESYKHAHARVVLSGTQPVADLLMKPPLDLPADPSNSSRLLSEKQYAELVTAMRKDVAPALRRRSRLAVLLNRIWRTK